MRGGQAGIAVVVAGLLAACAAPPSAGYRTAGLASTTAGPSAATADAAESAVNSQHDNAPADIRIDSGLARATLVTPRQPRPQVGQLIGMNASEVTQLLGIPKLQRREPPAEVWQYASSSCVMFVFLYDGRPGTALRSQSDGDWRVSYVEARSRQDSQPLPSADCLNGMFDRQPLALGES